MGLFESVPNFSEGRRLDVIDAIAGAANAAHVLDVDPDPDHNRVVISMAGSRADLSNALMGAVGEAARRIDMRSQEGVHPRVGAADVVPIVPLGSTTLEDCQLLAREIGRRIWSELELPVYFYGHGTDRNLADIRAGRVRPDLGADSPHPTAGSVCVGARPVLIAFNVLLPQSDLSTARRIARSLRESSGGMRGVQALAFELSRNRVQLSMNLFRAEEARAGDVLAALHRLGVVVGEQQLVGLCPAVFAGAFADGRLLEGRLAASAARSSSAKCLARGGDEMTALGRRLEREAVSLAQLASDQESLLAGAERVGALAAVLRAADALDAGLLALLEVAALGLRAALSQETKQVYAARAAALDRRIAEL